MSATLVLPILKMYLQKQDPKPNLRVWLKQQVN